MLKVHCDGSYYPALPDKPGYAAFSAVKGKKVIKDWGVPVDVKSCQEAEYMAIITALQWAVINGRKNIIIVSDSLSVITSLTRKTKNNTYENYRQLALYLASLLDTVSFKWVPREKNKQADRVCRKIASKNKKAVH